MSRVWPATLWAETVGPDKCQKAANGALDLWSLDLRFLGRPDFQPRDPQTLSFGLPRKQKIAVNKFCVQESEIGEECRHFGREFFWVA